MSLRRRSKEQPARARAGKRKTTEGQHADGHSDDDSLSRFTDSRQQTAMGMSMRSSCIQSTRRRGS